MNFPPKYGSNVVTLSFICFLGITCSYAEDIADVHKNIPSENMYTNITATNQIFSSRETSFLKLPMSDVHLNETITNSIVPVTDNLRKHRRKKGNKRRRRRKGHPVIGISLQQLDRNGSEIVNSRAYLKRKVTKRTRKIKKRRRKPKTENADILEIVTARVPGIPPSESTLNNSVIKEIIRQLNKNPERSMDEFEPFYGNKALNISSDSSLENSVDFAEKHASSEILETSTISSLQFNDRTLQAASAKQKNKKRKRKHKKRRRKLKRRTGKILGVSAARELHPPGIFESKSSAVGTIEVNSSEYNGNNTFPSARPWLENLVAPVLNSAGNPSFMTKTEILRFNNGNRTVHKHGKYNRCRKKRGGCAHICNREGSSKCSCLKGFILANDRSSCYDINECKINNGGCEMKCINTLGSYECQCPKGLRIADDLKSCEDVNECLLRNGHGPCQDTCENTHGSYKCSCARLKGTKLSDNGYSCEDLNECTKDNGGCSHECINTMGRAFCNCPYGLALSSDWKTCQESPPPQIQCPPSKHVKLERGEDEILVEFPSPITEVNWKYVKSNPPWAKDLMRTLRSGTHNINFTVRDPSTKTFSSCSFDIIVSSI